MAATAIKQALPDHIQMVLRIESGIVNAAASGAGSFQQLSAQCHYSSNMDSAFAYAAALLPQPRGRVLPHTVLILLILLTAASVGSCLKSTASLASVKLSSGRTGFAHKNGKAIDDIQSFFAITLLSSAKPVRV